MIGVQEAEGLREIGVFHFGGGHYPVLRAYHTDGRVKGVKSDLAELTRDGVNITASFTGITGYDDFAGLFQRGDHRFVIEGYQGLSVDDFHGNAEIRLKAFGGFYGAIQGGTEGQNG